MLLARSAPFLLAAAVGLLAPAAAGRAAGTDDTPCFRCHKPSGTTIDPERYGRSVHGGLDCAMCHTDGFAQFPHGGTRTDAPDCPECHSGSSPYDFDAIAKGVQESVHAALVDPAFRCTNCHSPHYYLPAARLADIAAGIAAANRSCLGCHAEGDSGRPALGALVDAHRWLPHPALHLRGNPCIACHTGLHGRPSTAALDGLIHTLPPAAEALKDCATCHSQNSLLATKLYAHLASRRWAEMGWLNPILFNTAYVTGATRNRWLDWGTVGLTALTLAGIGIHALGRWLGTRLRRRS